MTYCLSGFNCEYYLYENRDVHVLLLDMELLKNQIPSYMNSLFVDISAASPMMFTSTRQSVAILSTKMNIKVDPCLLKALVSKNDRSDSSCFYLIADFTNNYHVKLKKSLILKLKPSLNIAKKSMPLHLFENGS